MDAGRYDEACPKLEESQRLDPGGGTLLNLALCHERAGRIASAWAEYQEALSIAIKDGRKDRQGFARERAAALEPRLPRLTVTLSSPADAATVEVRLDGVLLGRGSLGVATPLDPGPHRVDATAPGKLPWSVTLHAAEGRAIGVPIPSLLPAPQPLAETPHPQTPGAAAAATLTCPQGQMPSGGRCVPLPAPGPAPVRTRNNPLWVGSVILAGGGFLVATSLGFLAFTTGQAASIDCVKERNYCPSGGSAVAMGWIATGGLAAMGVGLLGMAVLPTRTKVTDADGSETAAQGLELRVRGQF